MSSAGRDARQACSLTSLPRGWHDSTADLHLDQTPDVTLPSDRRVSIRFGLVDVALEVHDRGCFARLAHPEDWPRLSAVRGAIGVDEDEACERLRSAIERFGADEATPPRPSIWET